MSIGWSGPFGTMPDEVRADIGQFLAWMLGSRNSGGPPYEHRIDLQPEYRWDDKQDDWVEVYKPVKMFTVTYETAAEVPSRRLWEQAVYSSQLTRSESC